MPPGLKVGPLGLSTGIGVSGFVGGLVGFAAWLKIGVRALGGLEGGAGVAATGGFGGRILPLPPVVAGGLVVVPLKRDVA